MKQLNQFINEYIINKKLDKPIDSEDHYEYFPKTKNELIKNIKELFDNKIYDFNCINTSEIIDMSELFYKGIFSNIKFNVSKWDVSNVKSMRNMFKGCENFNCDLSKWKVSSNMTDISGMFRDCIKFDSDLSNWDVSNVKYMEETFSHCLNFKGKGLENWNVSNVKDMNYMLEGCTLIKNKPSWYKE